MKRKGFITQLIRMERTRVTMEPATFATIDGENWFQVADDTELGMELEIWKEDQAWRPLSVTLRWILQQSKGYMAGKPWDGVIMAVCAWCHDDSAGAPLPTFPHVSHGMCERCKAMGLEKSARTPPAKEGLDQSV